MNPKLKILMLLMALSSPQGFLSSAEASCLEKYLAAIETLKSEDVQANSGPIDAGGTTVMVGLACVASPLTCPWMIHDGIEMVENEKTRKQTYKEKLEDLKSAYFLLRETTTWGRGALVGKLVSDFADGDFKTFRNTDRAHLGDLLANAIQRLDAKDEFCPRYEHQVTPYSKIVQLSHDLVVQIAHSLEAEAHAK